VLVVGLAGCGRGTTEVSGKVTYNGRPVTSGSVAFAAPDGSCVYADILPDGTYNASGVPVGELKIAVSSPDPRSTPSNDRGGRNPPKAKAATPAPAGWVALPSKYAQPDQSGLSVTTTSKAMTHDIVMN
jgi:hypothetical protein